MPASPDEVQSFDYVIVGAGSAGCVLANRLSETGRHRVALLEAGGKDTSPLIRMPGGVGNLIANEGPQNWAFWTAPQKHLNGRKLWQPRGRGWGGSSSINGMIYTRGHARDYDQWRQMGLAGWSYRDVLPYFKRAEALETGADPWHGGDGPLFVGTPKSGHPLFSAFIEAGRQAGYPFTPDFNGARQEGVGSYQLTIKDGERWSASFAYLRPIAGKRANLEIISNARATRLLFEGRRCVGVEFAAGPGKPRRQVRATREVILAAGAMQSPHILQLSGVGDPAVLQAFGIETVAAIPDVGRNLQDHLDVTIIHDCTQPITVHSRIKGLRQPLVGLNYLLRKQGIGRFNSLEAGGFLKTRPELDRPDIQIHFVSAMLVEHSKVRPQRDGYSIHVCQLRPNSRGEVQLAGPDPFAAPFIDPRYLSAAGDLETLVDAVAIARKIFAQPAFDPYRGPEYLPGDKVASRAHVEAYIRAAAETIYHPVGTCRMGADDRAVTDETLKVRGLEGLRVVDASVMPTLVGGNTNAPTIMVAEKAADMILGKAALPAEDPPEVEAAA